MAGSNWEKYIYYLQSYISRESVKNERWKNISTRIYPLISQQHLYNFKVTIISSTTNCIGSADIISYDPLGRGSMKSIQKFIHRGSTHRNTSRRNTVTVEITGKYVIQIYSKQAGRGSEVNIISYYNFLTNFEINCAASMGASRYYIHL